ncbi:MAG TPA: DUF393 domain-containing protein [bacterium]|nr:DUF393 domain-containing protein [bacterium]
MRATVLFDGQCRLCRASVRTLRRLDWAGRLAYADARDPRVLRAHPGVDATRALQRLHLDVPDTDRRPRRVLDGFHAFRWIAGRLPALWLLWPWLWIPGAAALGTRIYDGVAGRRFLFGTCEDAACRVPEVRPPSGGPSPGSASARGESSPEP